jgi:hypothetical protein
MFKKVLMESSEIAVFSEACEFKTNSSFNIGSTQHSVDYYLVENCDYCFNDSKDLNKYGLCVSKRNNNVETEESIIESISNSREVVENIISSLCKHSVTPVALTEVLENLRFSL